MMSNENAQERNGLVKKTEAEKSSKPPAKPASKGHEDDPYCWVILFASFICNFIVEGLTYTQGLLQPDIKEEFGSGTHEVALSGSLLLGVRLMSGLVVSVLIDYFGFRKVTMFGSVFSATAFILASFAPSLPPFIVLYGIIGGFGFGCAWMPSIVIVGKWFGKRRATATGIAMAGANVGGMVLAPILSILLEEFGWRGLLIIEAGITLNCFCAGALYRAPPEPHKKPTSTTQKVRGQGQNEVDNIKAIELNSNTTQIRYENESAKERLLENRENGNGNPDVSLDENAQVHIKIEGQGKEKVQNGAKSIQLDGVSNDSNEASSKPKAITATKKELAKRVNSTTPNKPRFGRKILDLLKKSFDPKMIFRPIMLIMLISGLMSITSSLIPYVYTIILIRKSKVYTPEFIVNLFNRGEDATSSSSIQLTVRIFLIGLNAGNTVGRLMSGFLSDLPCMDAVWLNTMSRLIGGAAIIALAYLPYFFPLCILSFVIGNCMATYIMLRSVLLAELLGVELLTNSFGIYTFIQGIGAMLGSPTAGFLYDKTGILAVPFYFGGLLIFISGFISMPLRCMKNREMRRERVRHQQEQLAQVTYSSSSNSGTSSEQTKP